MIRIIQQIQMVHLLYTIQIIYNLPENTTIQFVDGTIKWESTSLVETLIILIISIIIQQLGSCFLGTAQFRGEVYLVMQVNLVGIIYILSSVDFITLIVAWELFNLSLYLQVSMATHSHSGGALPGGPGTQMRSSSLSASVKYFLQSAFSTTFILFSIAFQYGLTGSTNFEVIMMMQSSASEGGGNIGGLGQSQPKFLIIGAQLFKMGAAPQHNWAPDLYDNLPTYITLWMMTIPKMATLFLLHSLSKVFGDVSYIGYGGTGALQVQCIVAIISLLVGSISLGTQYKIKRFQAFSSISNQGFILLSITNFNIFIFYIQIYITSSIIFFTLLIIITISSENSDLRVTDQSGLFKLNPSLALAFALCLFSLAGCPPLAGFFTKLFVQIHMLDLGFYFVCFIIILSSVISTSNYISIIQTLFQGASPETPTIGPNSQNRASFSLGTAFESPFVSYPLAIFITAITAIIQILIQPQTDIVSLFILPGGPL